MAKIKQECILLIMNCKKYRFKAEKQKTLWIPFLPVNILYFHVIGDLHLQTPYFVDDQHNILYIKTEDDYNHLPKKVIRAYAAIQELFEYKYIFKTDDDQQLQTTQFFPTIMTLLLYSEPKIDYAGFMIDLKEDQVSKYYTFHPELPKNIVLKKGTYCNGRFYVLSYKAVSALLESAPAIEQEYFEDYAIGHYLPDKIKQNFLPLQTNVYFKDLA